MAPSIRGRARSTPFVAALVMMTLPPSCADSPNDATSASSSEGDGADTSSSGGVVDTGTTSVSTSAVDDGSTSGDPPPSDTTSSVDASESSSTGTPLEVPTPCDDIASVYVSEPGTEPNDTPEEATDLCTIDVVGSWHVAAEIGGDDLVDHFVFHTAGDSGVVPLLVDLCFDVTLDVALFQVGDAELILLWSGQSTLPSCDEVPAALPAGHDYVVLVEVPRGANVPGGTMYGW